jgi:hypothetical protein
MAAPSLVKTEIKVSLSVDRPPEDNIGAVRYIRPNSHRTSKTSNISPRAPLGP